MLSFLFKRRTPYQKAIAKVRRTGESWYLVSTLSCGFNPKITTADEAKEVVALLSEVEQDHKRFDSVEALGYLCEAFRGEEVRRYLIEHAQPILSRLVARADVPGELAMSCLRSVIALGNAAGISLFCRVIIDGRQLGSDLWHVHFRMLTKQQTAREAVVAQLGGKPLIPPLQQHFLSFANTLCREHGLARHPFDDDAGVAALGRMLDDASLEGGGVDIAASLPFLTHPGAAALMARCSTHPSRYVRWEAAWAAARLQDPSGIARLVSECADPIYAARPLAYLKELGAMGSLPLELRDPRHLALIEMADWLGHEMEYGRPPAAVTIIDDRVLIWPADREQRRVFLVRYHYPARNAEEKDHVGVGMVGASTFSLAGESTVTAEMTPEDIYATHCSWEMGLKDKATGKYSVSQGRALLGQLNPEFGG